MNEQNEIPPGQKYRWPWFVLAAVLLGIVLAVVWMGFAVKKIEMCIRDSYWSVS